MFFVNIVFVNIMFVMRMSTYITKQLSHNLLGLAKNPSNYSCESI